MDFLAEAQKLFTYTQTMRRDFHMHPELGFQEVRTAGIVAKELQSLGLEVTTGVGKTGVVALMEGGKPGPTLLLRADMDALPIIEQNSTEYVSQNSGVMHACGHDGHTAVLLTVAKLLNPIRNELAGTIKFVFQPAEEMAGGAQGMIADGVLENPKVDRVMGLHLWNYDRVGWLGIAEGPYMAGSDEFTITLTGKGGHAAIPQTAIDPIVTGAQIVNALQTIVSRNTAPVDAAVVSVTTFHGGDAFNVIPQTVTMTGTIRTFKHEVRNRTVERFQKIVDSIADSMGCVAKIELHQNTPPVINDGSTAASIQASARKILPGHTLDTSNHMTMGAEDFAYFLEKVPGCFFFVGSANAERGLDYAHHHPKFDIDEASLPQAAALMAQAAVDYLNK